jgi:hypothetical protein
LGSTLCLDKIIRAHLFERLFRKYTSYKSMVRRCVPIWNPFSATFHISIIYSRRRICFFIFCILKYLRRLQFLNAARDQGFFKTTTLSSSCFISFHSIMTFSKFTYNHQ